MQRVASTFQRHGKGSTFKATGYSRNRAKIYFMNGRIFLPPLSIKIKLDLQYRRTALNGLDVKPLLYEFHYDYGYCSLHPLHWKSRFKSTSIIAWHTIVDTSEFYLFFVHHKAVTFAERQKPQSGNHFASIISALIHQMPVKSHCHLPESFAGTLRFQSV